MLWWDRHTNEATFWRYVAVMPLSTIRPAPLAVHARIMSLRRALADENRITSWLMIDDAVHELVRVTPRETDTVH